jgi:uncharacterized protein (TIGR02996 family)
MGEEAAFLSAIRQTPAEETTRLVYADWLDEQGDPESKTKADFIRLEVQMAATPEQSLNRVRWLTKLQKLAVALAPRWLAVVSHPKLEACRVSFRYPCPKQWEKLAPTDCDKVRFCGSCKQHVHYCETIHEARDRAAKGHCVAVTLAIVRRPDDLYQPRPLTPGMIERLAVAGRPNPMPIDPAPTSEPPLFVPPIRRQWDPAPEVEPTRPRRQKRRRPGRARNRNIQRQDWEEE